MTAPAAATRPDLARMRQIAAQIQADNPRWIVMFGVYSRQFVAFPRFDAPMIAFVAVLYPEALPPRLRAVEAKARPVAGDAAAGEADTITFRLAG